MDETNPNPNGGYLARVYSLAIAYPEDVPDYIKTNQASVQQYCIKESFGQYFIDCLKKRALGGPNPGDVHDRAMEITSLAGVPQLGPQLAQEFLKERTDMILLARYLEDIIRVTPDILSGTTDTYQQSSLYNTMSFVWQNAAGLVAIDYLRSLKHISFELNEWYVDNLMATVRLDYQESAWPRVAQSLRMVIERYEMAKADGSGVRITVTAAVISGITLKFALLLGLTDEEVTRMSANQNVDALVEWLQDSGWLD